jgi:hypothetical protein
LTGICAAIAKDRANCNAARQRDAQAGAGPGAQISGKNGIFFELGKTVSLRE